MRVSQKAAQFTESVIREMTRLSDAHDAINLSQGFPNFPAPDFIKEAACGAIRDDINQYAVTWGAPRLREAIAAVYADRYDMTVDPDRNLTVCCGATECMIASLLAVADPGERIVVLEPFYENYGPDAVISGASPIFVPMGEAPDWELDADRLEAVISQAQKEGGVRALILNSPHNPTGRIFNRSELETIAELAQRYDFLVVTDEIYEYIVYDGLRHEPIATLDGMWDRTITISGLSKTFSVTGWRIGYVAAPEALSEAIRKMHDFLTVGAPAPLQEAAAIAMEDADHYYGEMASHYGERRDYFVPQLRKLGFKAVEPAGAYYVMADISGLTELNDIAFVTRLIKEAGVAAVPGSSFFSEPARGSQLIRFAFCKTMDMLEEAVARLGAVQDWSQPGLCG